MTENAKQLSKKGVAARGGGGVEAGLFIAPNGRWLAVGLGHSPVAAAVAAANVATLKSGSKKIEFNSN